MDLSKSNSMAAEQCGFSPDEVLRIILESEVVPTRGFKPDWKSSCSISLIRLWLNESCIKDTDRRDYSTTYPAVKGGGDGSCTILFSFSLDWISLKAISQSPVNPT